MRSILLFLATLMNLHAADIPLQPDADEKAADPVMGSAAGWTVRLDIDGYFPDEGVLVSTKSTDFWKQGSGAFITKPPYLNGKERQKYHRVYIRATGEDWAEQMVTIVPDADGKLTLSCYVVAPGAMNLVQWDDIRVEGATLKNGGFEKIADDGSPKGWHLSGWNSKAPKGEVIHDPRGAAEGERYVQASWTWQWNATITDVKKDQPIILRWKNRFITAETRYPVRVGFNGIASGMALKTATGMQTNNDAPERYIGRLLDGFDIKAYGDPKQVRNALGIYLAQAGEEWTERTITVEPESDGELELTFHGARIRDLEKNTYTPILIDYKDITVEGATLPDQEEWERIGKDTDIKIRHDGFVRTWYQAGLRTKLTDIQAGTPVVITLKVRVPNFSESMKTNP